MIDVMIIAFNEALNLPHCLAALQGWTKNVFVIDSGSTDGSQDIARSFGAQVVHHDWEGYARQKNWGLTNLPFESPWILIIDADEIITPRLRDRLEEIASRSIDHVPENGFFINRVTYFLDKPILHCGYFPSWNMRFFKRGVGQYEDREVHEHMIMPDPVGYIREPMIHNDRRGLEHYIAKHNRYSTLEARALFEEIERGSERHAGVTLSKTSRLHRWLKRHVMPYVPFPSTWRFLYMYIVRLGILDGPTGYQFCRFISEYDYMVALKLRDLRRQARRSGGELPPTQNAPVRGLAAAEGDDPVMLETMAKTEVPAPAHDASSSPTQMQPEASPWTFKEKLGRAIWMLVGRPIFRISFHNWYGFRAWLLRRFGARIGQGVALRPSVNIEVPWMLEIDDGATIGDHAILYCLGPIRIGKRSIISQYAHLCAGTHDYTDHTFRLIRSGITIGDDAWIGADAFVGPGVTVGNLSVLGARSSTYKNLGDHMVYVGNPAKSIKERVLR